MQSSPVDYIKGECLKMKSYGLKKIPSDIYKFIYSEQDRLKKQRCTNKFSFETTIYNLLRDHPRFIEFKNKIDQDKL